MAPQPAPEDPLMVAVRSFESQGADGPGAAFGEAEADRLTAALADRQAPTVSRELTKKGELGHARLLVGGGVEREGAVMRVRVQMDDAQSGQALWSTSFERPAAEGAALQNQAATNVAEVIARLREDLGEDAKGIRPEVLAAYMKAADFAQRNRGSFEQQRQAYRRLVQLTPQSSRAHSSLANAISLTLRLTKVPSDVAALWRTEALAEANKALALDPQNAGGYIALYDLTSDRDYRAREAWVAKAKAASPDTWGPLGTEAEFLKGVGRMQESITAVQQALAQVPYRPGMLASNIFGLAGVDRYAEAEASGAWAARLMPENNSVRRANLFTALLYAPPDKAAAAIDVFQAGQARLEPGSEKAWRDFVAARAGKLAPEVAVKELLAAPRAENGVDPSTAMSGFALLGRLDDAFAEAERASAQDLELHISNVFEPPAAPMRRDPRFMPLMAQLGLADYWLKSDRWPDFCRAPGLPYDCKSAAQAALKTAATKG
jgi:TolB-like protein